MKLIDCTVYTNDTIWIYQPAVELFWSTTFHIDPVARLDSFRAIKLFRLENSRALKLMDGFLTLKLSILESLEEYAK